MPTNISFDDETIHKLFGNEDAAFENPKRLKEYYFKSNVYNRIVNNLPLRILVGHKGIGKSALFYIALHEDEKSGKLAILIKPDDIKGLELDSGDFLKKIREWTDGLNEIIARKVFDSLGIDGSKELSSISKYGGKLLNFLFDTLKSDHIKVNLEPTKILLHNFLQNKIITVYIDDLDRGWESKKSDIFRISALLNAIKDIHNKNNGILFRVALRSDVYFLVRTSDESTDKIEGAVVWFKWTNHEIFVLLIKRIETFFGREVNEDQLLLTPQMDLSSYLNSIMEPRFLGKGNWSNIPTYRLLMSLIRRRPRDLIKLCTLAANKAFEDQKNLIGTSHFMSSFEEYSQGRIQDTINEHRSELPNIERLIMGMKPSKKQKKTIQQYVYDTGSLINKMKNILEQGDFTFANGLKATPKQLIQFLYKINFLTARKRIDSGEIVRKYFEENRYLYTEFADFGFDWEIHPAYRWALQPGNTQNIFNEIDLAKDIS